MAAFSDVFERKEIKYRLNAAQHAAMRQMLDERMEVDGYGRSLVSSLYLDTPDRSLIARSLEKPLYKEKLRLRTYGAPVRIAQDVESFLEIKKKYKGIVYKRRVCVTSKAAWEFMKGMDYQRACEAYPLADPEAQMRTLGHKSLQISREIRQFVDTYAPLRPSMLINCQRTALRMREGQEDDVRITFDEEVCCRDLMARHAYEMPLLPEGDCIMEIKICGAMPMWLVKILNAAQARPSSFSKYGTAYQAVMAS